MITEDIQKILNKSSVSKIEIKKLIKWYESNHHVLDIGGCFCKSEDRLDALNKIKSLLNDR